MQENNDKQVQVTKERERGDFIKEYESTKKEEYEEMEYYKCWLDTYVDIFKSKYIKMTKIEEQISSIYNKMIEEKEEKIESEQ